MDNQESRQAQIKELLEKTTTGTKEVFESDKYREYLTIMSKFHNYSFRNSMLILLQKPEATYVAGYVAWQEKFNRQVMSDEKEKGIQIVGYAPKKVISEEIKKDTNGNTVYGADGQPEKVTTTKLIPYFTPTYVYDISQTEGEPLPQLVNELNEREEDETSEYSGYISYLLKSTDLIETLTEISLFPIVFEDIQGGAKGYCDPSEKKIAIKSGMSRPQTIKTAIHEITHADLHSQEPRDTAQKVDRRTMEVQAESTAFVVCSHYGIDTSDYTFPYLASWSSNKNLTELQNSLETIQKQAGALIDRIDKRLADLQKARDKDIVKGEYRPITPFHAASIIEAHAVGNTDRSYSKYLTKENDKWIAIDDSTHNCNVEEFTQRDDAISWLNGDFEIGEYQNGLLDKTHITGMGGIRANDPNAVSKLQTKLDGLETLQDTMKAVNAYFRKYKTLDGCQNLSSEQLENLKADMSRNSRPAPKPFESYMLTNNNAEIRRIKARIEELTRRSDTVYAEWQFKGGKVKANLQDSRLQIFFDEKPDAEIRSELKGNGFRWAPKAGAWQRLLADNAYYAANRISAILPITREKPTDLQKRIRLEAAINPQPQVPDVSDYYEDSLKHDNDIDLDREMTREQQGFNDALPNERLSMRERFLAAQEESRRRSDAQPDLVPSKDRNAEKEIV